MTTRSGLYYKKGAKAGMATEEGGTMSVAEMIDEVSG